MTHPPMIVFTDLDGTLLDHDNYDFSPALPALTRLKDIGIPVVLASSKTAAEIAPLRDELGFSNVPAIVENGAGLLPANQSQLPAGGTDYHRIRAALGTLPADLRANYRGFGDVGPMGVAEITGLPQKQATLAAHRQFSEPGLWSGTAEDQVRFIDTLAQKGITAREGGRFLTLSFGRTKADRIEALAADYDAPLTVALGDAPNDREMLEAAAIGVVIANPHRAPLPPLATEPEGRIRRTAAPGPSGWNTAIHDILNEIGL